MHVLGIDAGGTKTVCLLADEHGTIVAEARGPGANLHAAGELAVEKVLHEVMEQAIGDRPIVPAAICLGIAGVDRGDEAQIGREALAAVMRAADGRGPDTALATEILAYFNVADVSRLPRIVYDREMPRMSVAALGPIVQTVAADGDAVAVRILERAADELGLGARSVTTRLEMRGDAFTFYLSGGVFRVVPWLADELPRRLVEVAPRSQVQILQEEPAVGAVWLALAEARGEARVPRYKPVMANGKGLMA